MFTIYVEHCTSQLVLVPIRDMVVPDVGVEVSGCVDNSVKEGEADNIEREGSQNGDAAVEREGLEINEANNVEREGATSNHDDEVRHVVKG